MPGLRNKLTAATVRSTVKTGRHADGAGLYLQVTRHPVLGNIRKSWLVRTWLIPEERMKAGRPHRIPLTEATIAILKTLQGHDKINVFPGLKAGKPISNMVFLMTLRRMKREGLTAHGFRSTFRDWAAERTDFQGEVAEAALAHVVGNKVEAAYRRGDLFEKRRALMEAWARFAVG
jgi:integrase